MNKKGFTMVEILAVMAILAIVGLITMPIVLDKIEESEQKSLLLSAEHYLRAVDISIMNREANQSIVSDGEYNILQTGNICLEYENNNCVDILEVKVNKQYPKSGYITLVNGEIDEVSIDLNDKEIIKDSEGQLAFYIPPCTLVSGDKNTNGSKYLCEVKPGTKYNFYVMGQNSDGTTNLIMEQNINSDGTPAGTTIVEETENPSKYNRVSWKSSDSNNAPDSAINFLYNATKDWVNIKPLNYEYYVCENCDGYRDYADYKSFVSERGISKINSFTGIVATIGTKEEPLRARILNTNEMGESYARYLRYNVIYDNYYWTLESTGWDSGTRGTARVITNTDTKSIASSRLGGIRPIITVEL